MTLNETWLNGTYTVDNHKVEINTSLPYFAVDGHRCDFFAQGDDVNTIIAEIHNHWLKSGESVENSVSFWINAYL